MTLKRAIQILEQHNKWRRGCEKETITNPVELGVAIDVILKELKKL